WRAPASPRPCSGLANARQDVSGSTPLLAAALVDRVPVKVIPTVHPDEVGLGPLHPLIRFAHHLQKSPLLLGRPFLNVAFVQLPDCAPQASARALEVLRSGAQNERNPVDLCKCASKAVDDLTSRSGLQQVSNLHPQYARYVQSLRKP